MITEHMRDAVWGDNDARRDISYLLSGVLFSSIDYEELLTGAPKIFVSDHRVTVDLLLFMCQHILCEREPVLVVSWTGAAARHPTSVMRLIKAHPGHENSLLGQLASECPVDSLKPAVLHSQLSDIEKRLIDTPANVLIAAEGVIRRDNAAPVEYCSSWVISLAKKYRYPVVPIRMLWAVPEADTGFKYAWPYRLAPMRARVGRPICADALERLSLVEAKRCVVNAINGLYRPAPAAHFALNDARAERVSKITQEIGINQTKALLCDHFLTLDERLLSDEGRVLRSWLCDRFLTRKADQETWLYRTWRWLSEAGTFDRNGVEGLYDWSRLR